MSAPHPQWKTLHLLPLSSGAVHSFRVTQGRLLTVRQGRVWLTQQGQAADFWLTAGDSILLTPQCLLVVEADGDSEIALESQQRWPARHWLARAAQWLRQCLSAMPEPARRSRA